MTNGGDAPRDGFGLKCGVGFDGDVIFPYGFPRSVKIEGHVFESLPDFPHITLHGSYVGPEFGARPHGRLSEPQVASLEAGACGKESNREKKNKQGLGHNRYQRY
jgi:hypothetical protein